MKTGKTRQKRNILEAANVIRSKNSGPYELTLDIMFKDRHYYDLFRKERVITRAKVARMYGIAESDVLKVIYFEPSLAVKMTIRRRIPSGAPGDSDIYGAHQHAPLLKITF
ncbi:MAG: DUF4387 domain-containing protein [Acidobacteriota bacterium]